MEVLGIRIGFANTSAAVASASARHSTEILLPSVVARYGGVWAVGNDAKALAVHRADTCHIGLPRDLDLKVRLNENDYAPSVIVGLLVSDARRQAEREIGGAIRHCAFSVPGSLGQPHLHLLREAAAEAGLEVVSMNPDAVCALAAASSDSSDESQHALVIRVGARQTTVSIVKRNGLWSVVTNDGDENLGGSVLDDLIAAWYLELLSDRNSEMSNRLRADPRARNRLLLLAEEAKVALRDRQSVVIPPLDSEDFQSTHAERLSQAEFDRLAEPMARRILGVVHRTLDASTSRHGICAQDIGLVLLHGGGSQLRSLRRSLSELLPQAKLPTIEHPSTLSARGAGLLALRELVMKPQVGPLGSGVTLHQIQFTVFRPKVARPSEWCPMLVFTHLSDRRPDAPPDAPEPIAQVRAQARQALGADARTFREVSTDARRGVPRDGEITIVPDVQGIEFNPERRTFRWVEDVHKEEFRMRAGEDLVGTIAHGRIAAYLGIMLLAEIDLSIRVSFDAPHMGEEGSEEISARPYRRIFASYSHSDVDVLRQFERYVEAFGDSYLRDVRHLRAGEVWDEGLLRLIDQADVFQLFWSTNAMRSKHVRREWEYALSLNRSAFVRPTYWEVPLPESPADRLPPDTLRKLHFHRIGSVSESHADRANQGLVDAGEGAALSLTLEIASTPGPVPSVRRHTFREEGGSIGRGKGNDWVLPHNKVSTNHAVITCRSRLFYIQDNSRNGVYLNSESDRVTPKVPQLLQSGDNLFIEPYRIQVTISKDADKRALTDADVDPFAPIAAPRGASPLVPNLLHSPDVGGADEGAVNEVDPLKLLGGDAGLGEPGGGGRHGRRRSPEREIRTAEERELNGDPLGASPAVPPPPPPPKPQLPLQGTRFDPPTGYNPLHDSGVDRGSTAPPPAADRSLPSDPFEFLDTDERVATEPADPNPPPRPWVTPQGTAPEPAARPAPPPPPELLRGALGEPHAAIQPEVDLQAVLAGAGLANVQVTPALAEDFGRILRIVVGGVMEMLRARQEVKDEFRMRQTQFRAADNNPLKFSANVDDALHNLLVKRNAAYLEPVEAFASAFADLRNHELAMLAGLRVAFEAMLADFDADRLEEEFNREHKKGALVSVPAKLRYWDAYRNKCQRLLQDVEATYRRWFGEEFVKAYEEQLVRLEAERQHRTPSVR